MASASRRLLVAALSVFLGGGLAGQACAKILVVYPLNPKEFSVYRDFLDGVLEGIKSVIRDDFSPVPVPVSISEAQALTLLEKTKQEEGAIWLGPQGLGPEEARKIPAELKLVFGWMHLSPDEYPNLSGVSLQTDPDPLLKFARAVLPGHSRLVYIYHPTERSYLEILKQAAARWKFDLVLHPVGEASAKTHKELLPTLNGEKEALLLSPDPRVMDKSLYRVILVRSWELKIPILCNLLMYSVAGCMIASYPDPVAYGQQLALLLEDRMKANAKPRVELAKGVKFAFNARYAQRLSIELPAEWRDKVSRLIEW